VLVSQRILKIVANRGKRMMEERLRGVLKSHPTTYRIARNIYRGYENANNKYQNQKLKREFYSRIEQINTNEYLDISQKPNLNVIIVVVDCLRNSHLSCQGYFRETTPFLDSLQSRFTAISASPWTYPSVASIMTGLYPHNHGATLTGQIKDLRKLETYRKLGGGVLTLPEMLFFLGYRIYFNTAVENAYYPLRGRVIPQRNLPPTKADVLLNHLMKWIATEKRKKFFAYIHLGDLHIPLDPSNDFKNFFGNVKNLPNIDGWDFFRPEQYKKNSEKFREYKENRQLLYDNLLRYVDYAIERFYNSLKDMGLADSTIFIITGDHAEEFWEHAELEAEKFYIQDGVCGISHGRNVFNEIIEVPLLMSGPIPSSKPNYFVSSVDIVPTVADLLGISCKIRFDGRNIFKTDGERPLLSEASGSGYEKKALVVGRYKLICSKDDEIAWLFDLERDPYEQHPIADRQVTSVYVDKLNQMLKEDEKRKIREIAKKKSLFEVSNI
jgi:arylsulfatase A-like enzyme